MPTTTAPLQAAARLRERVIAARAPSAPDRAPDGLPYPPAGLRVLVDGHGDPAGFLQDSAAGRDAVLLPLQAAGVDIGALDAVLDFGCGCGRVARNWHDRGWDLHGCDYNPRLTEWCAHHLPFMQTRVNMLAPPTGYPDRRFDLVYAISILTHLTEPLARAWAAEWHRIIRPGGWLVVSTHGDQFRGALNRRQRRRYDAGDMVVKRRGARGANLCAAYHPRSYVRQLLDGFELMPLTAAPIRQDVHVARRL